MYNIKSVTLNDMNDFFILYGNKIVSYYGNTNERFWNIKFRLKDEKEILQFWKDRGFCNFKNLTLIFE